MPSKKRADREQRVIHMKPVSAGDDQHALGNQASPVVATHSRKGRSRAGVVEKSKTEMRAAKSPRKGRTAEDSLKSPVSVSSVKSPARGRRARAHVDLPPAIGVPSAPINSAGLNVADALCNRASGGDGHSCNDARLALAVANNSSGQLGSADHVPAAAGGEGQIETANLIGGALADLIADVVDTHRQRRSLLVAEGDMTRRIKSKERSSAVYRYRKNGIELPKGKFPPVSQDDIALIAGLYPAFYEARSIIEKQRKAVEKRLIKTAGGLPLVEWAEGVRGLGILSLAAIIGEAGDLSKYSNPGKLWKRMGLAVFDGKSQRKVAGDDAIRQGYSPERRSVMFVIGDNLIRAANPEYRAVYDARKAYEIERNPEIKPIIAHRRAKRYMEKRLLREMWKAWRQAVLSVEPTPALPDAKPYSEAAE